MFLPNKNIEDISSEATIIGGNIWGPIFSERLPILTLSAGKNEYMQKINSISDYERGKILFHDIEISKWTTWFSSSWYLVWIEDIQDIPESLKTDNKYENKRTIILDKFWKKRIANFDLVASCKAWNCNFLDLQLNSNTGIFWKILYFMDEKNNWNFIDLEKNESILKMSGKDVYVINPSLNDTKLSILRKKDFLWKSKLHSIDQDWTIRETSVNKTLWKTLTSVYWDNKLDDTVKIHFKTDSKIESNIVYFVNLTTWKEFWPFTDGKYQIIWEKYIAIDNDTIDNAYFKLIDNNWKEVLVIDKDTYDLKTIFSLYNSIINSWYDYQNNYLRMIVWSYQGRKKLQIFNDLMDEKLCLEIKGLDEIKNISFNGKFITVNHTNEYCELLDITGKKQLDINSARWMTHINVIWDKCIFQYKYDMYITDIANMISEIEFKNNWIFCVNWKKNYLKKWAEKWEYQNLNELIEWATEIKNIGIDQVEIKGKIYKKKHLKLPI